ncbi:hypothetical protein BROUX41_004722 [Berkeleyomyces rouxiae]|uniref:uncharacterized protein n=1 Tax=Berkeleyomyces rouxiae TaxID=2035830 RepID=UPI003B7B21B7
MLSFRTAFTTAARSSSSAAAAASRASQPATRNHVATIARRAYSSAGAPPPPPPSPKKNNGMSVLPFLGVVVLGTGAYMMLVNSRKDLAQQQRAKMAAERAAAAAAAVTAAAPPEELPAPEPTTTAVPPAATADSPAFDPADVTVFFVLGGPGAGKGTQCARLVSEYGFTHLSAGDLLRAEQDRPGSQFGDLIRDYIKNGQIVPMEVTIKLLENAMTETMGAEKKGRFLIDGFPRKMDQAVKFEESVCPAKLVLFFECPEKELERRLLERGKTSGRADDNIESIRKRFRTFIETSMPVVENFRGSGRVVHIDSSPSPEEVYNTTIEELTKKVGKL